MSAVDKSGQCLGSVTFRVANLLSVSAASQLTDVHQSAYLQLLCNNMTAEARLAPIVASINIRLLLHHAQVYKHLTQQKPESRQHHSTLGKSTYCN